MFQLTQRLFITSLMVKLSMSGSASSSSSVLCDMYQSNQCSVDIEYSGSNTILKHYADFYITNAYCTSPKITVGYYTYQEFQYPAHVAVYIYDNTPNEIWCPYTSYGGCNSWFTCLNSYSINLVPPDSEPLKVRVHFQRNGCLGCVKYVCNNLIFKGRIDLQCDPVQAPTPPPTLKPTPHPTPKPTPLPSPHPTSIPTLDPSSAPTSTPTSVPTKNTMIPTEYPSKNPTAPPTLSPSSAPTNHPTAIPTTINIEWEIYDKLACT
eukprot:369579_1